MRWLRLEIVRGTLCRLLTAAAKGAEWQLVRVRAQRDDAWRIAGVGSSVAGVLGERELL